MHFMNISYINIGVGMWCGCGSGGAYFYLFLNTPNKDRGAGALRGTISTGAMVVWCKALPRARLRGCRQEAGGERENT
jgi:hypothetical protein